MVHSPLSSSGAISGATPALPSGAIPERVRSVTQAIRKRRIPSISHALIGDFVSSSGGPMCFDRD